MPNFPRPRPQDAVTRREQIPFHKELTFRLNGSMFVEDAQVVYRTSQIVSHGYTQYNAFVSLVVLEDSGNPVDALGLIGVLGQKCGSSGAISPTSAVGFNIPGLFINKGYIGQGKYSLFLVQSGSQNVADGIGTGVAFELYALGRPEGRVLTIQLDGVIVGGKHYFKRRR